MVEGTPPGDALPPPPQRATPARKDARCGAGARSPRPHRPHPGRTGRGIQAARSRGRAAGGGTAPDTRRHSQRWQATPPPGTAPDHPRGTQPPQGMQARGTVLGPHTHTPAPTARGWRTPTARPVGGQSGEGRRLASDAPHNGGRHPPPGDALPPPPQRATPARKGARCGAGAGSPRPHRPHPGHTGRRTLAARSRGRAAGEGTAPDTRRPSQQWQAHPSGTAPHQPCGTQPPQGMQAKGTVLGPHTHTPAPTARGWRTPTARPMGGQSGEGQRLTSDAPHNGGRHPPRGRPSATPTASNAGPQGRTLWGRCWVSTPASTASGTHRSRNPGCPLQRTGGRGRDSACYQAPLTTVAGHPPGDGPRPPPQHAAPAGHAGRGDSIGPPHPHTRAHSTWAADPNSPPSGRAVGGGTAPGLRRFQQWWKAAPPGTPFRHPHSEQRRPARAHAVWPVLGPHAHIGRTRDTRVAEPWLPAPEDGRPGEGQRLTPGAPHNGGRPAPLGTAPHHPRGTQPPQGMQAKGTVLGPHTHTPAPTARGWRTPTARRVGGQSGEGQRLTLDASHNGGRHAPRGNPFRIPHSEQRRPARAHAVGPVLGPHARTDRARDTRDAEPWLPTPEDERPGEGQRLTPGAPHNSGRPPPLGTAPHHPRGTQPPQGMQAKGTVLGPHTHTPAPTARGWRTPTARPVGRQSGEGRRLASDAPHNAGRHPPPGTPFCHPHSEQRRPARAHAVGPMRGPHAPTDRTRDTRVAEPWLPAPEDGRPGEGQRLTPGAPHNSGRPPPRGRPPTTPAASSPRRTCRPRGQYWAPTPTHPRPQHVGGGPQQPAQWAGSRGRDGAWTQTPPTMVEGTPPGDALPPPPQRATPARKGARCGAGAGSPLPHRPHPGHTGRGTLAARSRGRAAGGGTAPDTRRPSGRPTPPGDGPPPPPRHAAPTGHAGQGDSVGPPHPHTRAHSTWVADPNSPPSGQAVGRGIAPDLRRPSQRWTARPPGTPFGHPHSEQRRPARAHAVGPLLGFHARTDRTRDTRVAEPWLPAPEDGRPGEGQRLTPGAPHNGGRPPPPGTAPHHPRGTQSPQGMQAKGTVLGPNAHTPPPTAPGWRSPTARPMGGQSREGQRLTSDAPHNGGRHPPRGRSSATPTVRNAGPHGRTLWGWCWVPTPAPTAPGTRGSRNPGYPLQRTSGRGRDSA